MTKLCFAIVKPGGSVQKPRLLFQQPPMGLFYHGHSPGIAFSGCRATYWSISRTVRADSTAGGDVNQLGEVIHLHRLRVSDSAFKNSDLIVRRSASLCRRLSVGATGFRFLAPPSGPDSLWFPAVLALLQVQDKASLVFSRRMSDAFVTSPAPSPDETVAAHAGRRVDGAGDGEYVPPCSSAVAAVISAPLFSGAFHHQSCQRQPGDDSVSHGKNARCSSVPGGYSGKENAG